MILSATLSKPVKEIETILGRPYTRIRIRANTSSSGTAYFMESFTEKQAFHAQMTEPEFADFLDKHAGRTFRSCVERTETEEITILANKKGETTTLRKPLKPAAPQQKRITAMAMACDASGAFNRVKHYLLPEGTPVPFLVLLGVMTPEGKVVNAKYDKFRQINRFLEFIDDILPDVQKLTGASPDNKDRPIRIADFGCGKSYLTFAVHYYLTQIKKIPVEITGLDLKKDVIDYCSRIAEKLRCDGLTFETGDIAGCSYRHDPDIVITLHACDTATDYALDYAVKHDCKAVLSVPCCQHEINAQLRSSSAPETISGQISAFAPLLRYGLIKERFAALATDALRAEYLEAAGYSVQVLEFIDMEHTPKNLLIRAVKAAPRASSRDEAHALTGTLNITQTLDELLKKK
jgi:hypothetical protein